MDTNKIKEQLFYGCIAGGLAKTAKESAEWVEDNFTDALEFLSTEIGLSQRAMNALDAQGISSDRLVEFTRSQVMSFRNIGQKTIDEFDAYLKAKGIWYKGG